MKLASEVLIERLAAWGVKRVYGLPGDGINGLMEGLRRHPEVEFILVQHEEAAAFMAAGEAKMTGGVGVCLSTSGPGAIHLLNGLYDAKMDHVPVLAITGVQATTVLGTGYQQEVPVEHLFSDVAGYNMMVTAPASISALVDAAMKSCIENTGVSHLTFPVDLQEADADEVPYGGGLGLSRKPASLAAVKAGVLMPEKSELEKAADILNSGQKVALLVGWGALGASSEVEAVAARLGAPVVKALRGKGVLPDNHPYTTGGIGLLGSDASEKVLAECDRFLMVGTSFPYTAYLPPVDTPTVQIDNSLSRLGGRMAQGVGLLGDSAATLEALLPLLDEKQSHGWLKHARDLKKEWDAQLLELAKPAGAVLRPETVAQILDEISSDEAIMACDTGTVTAWMARYWQIRGEREFYVCGNLASMGPGLPYANVAALLHPEREVIAVMGDGGMSMLMGELLTAQRCDLPIKVVVFNNGALGQILWEQLSLGYPEFGVRWNHRASFAEWARACGGFGVKVETLDELRAGLGEALSYQGMALVDVIVDADEPPLPGIVQPRQAVNFAKSMLKGEFHHGGILKSVIQDGMRLRKSH